MRLEITDEETKQRIKRFVNTEHWVTLKTVLENSMPKDYPVSNFKDVLTVINRTQTRLILNGIIQELEKLRYYGTP